MTKINIIIIYKINQYRYTCMCQNSQSHSHPSSLLPVVPRTAAALPLCTATEILCRRNSQVRGSPVALQRRLPRSLIKSNAASPNTPEVSTTKGTKWWLVSRCAYLATFNWSACAATTPAPLTAAETCEGAWVSGHVASHTRTFPHLHGRMEQPSGRFPSDQYRPQSEICE